jgi:hypothetical protein
MREGFPEQEQAAQPSREQRWLVLARFRAAHV